MRSGDPAKLSTNAKALVDAVAKQDKHFFCMYYVYILQSYKDSSYYIGTTLNLARRLDEHNKGTSDYSSHKAPFKIIWYCACVSRKVAYNLETYLKSSSGHAFWKKRFI